MGVSRTPQKLPLYAPADSGPRRDLCSEVECIGLHPCSCHVGRRGSPKRSSLPLSARHAITASPASLDASPQPPRFADLVDSAEPNERGIDITFPPTPPSSRSEHESSHLQISAELSSNVENVSPDSGSEHYRKFPALQAVLHPASALRSSGRRRFKSHLLQLTDDGESRDLESSELRTYKNYVLTTGSPLGIGRSG